MQTTSLAAILFVELPGFQELLAKDEGAAISILSAWRGIAGQVLASHSGELVDATGDELLVVFTSAVSALKCAIDLREGARTLPPGHEGPLAPGAGIHLGEIWRDESKVYGNGINVAARIKAEAAPGQILVSEDFWRQISNKLDLPTRAIPDRHLKNIERDMAIYEVAYQGPAAPAVEAPATRPAAASSAQLTREGPPLSELIARLAHASPPAPAQGTPAIGTEEVKAAFRTVIQKAMAGEQPGSGSADPEELKEAVSGLISKVIAEKTVIKTINEGPGGKKGLTISFGEAEEEEEHENEDHDAVLAPDAVEASPAERRRKASKEISKGMTNLAMALVAAGVFGYFYLQKPGLLLAAGAALLGIGPALAGLKRVIMGLFALHDAKKDEKRQSLP